MCARSRPWRTPCSSASASASSPAAARRTAASFALSASAASHTSAAQTAERHAAAAASAAAAAPPLSSRRTQPAWPPRPATASGDAAPLAPAVSASARRASSSATPRPRRSRPPRTAPSRPHVHVDRAARLEEQRGARRVAEGARPVQRRQARRVVHRVELDVLDEQVAHHLDVAAAARRAERKGAVGRRHVGARPEREEAALLVDVAAERRAAERRGGGRRGVGELDVGHRLVAAFEAARASRTSRASRRVAKATRWCDLPATVEPRGRRRPPVADPGRLALRKFAAWARSRPGSTATTPPLTSDCCRPTSTRGQRQRCALQGAVTAAGSA